MDKPEKKTLTHNIRNINCYYHNPLAIAHHHRITQTNFTSGAADFWCLNPIVRRFLWLYIYRQPMPVAVPSQINMFISMQRSFMQYYTSRSLGCRAMFGSALVENTHICVCVMKRKCSAKEHLDESVHCRHIYIYIFSQNVCLSIHPYLYNNMRTFCSVFNSIWCNVCIMIRALDIYCTKCHRDTAMYLGNSSHYRVLMKI